MELWGAVNLPVLTGEDIEEMAYALLTEKQKKLFEQELELDFSLLLPNVGRFRANYVIELWEILLLPSELFRPKFPPSTIWMPPRYIRIWLNGRRG